MIIDYDSFEYSIRCTTDDDGTLWVGQPLDVSYLSRMPVGKWLWTWMEHRFVTGDMELPHDHVVTRSNARAVCLYHRVDELSPQTCKQLVIDMFYDGSTWERCVAVTKEAIK
jgi:hypothetical protein